MFLLKEGFPNHGLFVKFGAALLSSKSQKWRSLEKLENFPLFPNQGRNQEGLRGLKPPS